MTAIYAYASRDDAMAFIGADNWEVTSGSRMDKVFYLYDRFAIGICGIDIPARAISAMGIFEKVVGYEPMDSVLGLATIAARLSRLESEWLFPRYQGKRCRGEISDRDWDLLMSNSATNIILDCAEYRLYQVDLGPLFPTSSHWEKEKLTELSDRRLHLFGLAAKARGSPTQGVHSKTITDPNSFLTLALEEDRRRFREIGSLGSTFVIKEQTREFRSVFRDPEDYLQETSKRIEGYNLIIMGPERVRARTLK